MLLIILAALTACAQPVADGLPLIQQVVEAARSAKGWRAEGARGAKVGETPAGPVIGDQTLRRFTVATGGPLEMRYVVGLYPVSYELKVCDGTHAWNKGVIGRSDIGPQITNPFPDGFVNDATAQKLHPLCPSCGPAKECDSPPGLPWQDLLPSLSGEILVVGKDNALGCTVVSAEYKRTAGLELLNFYDMAPGLMGTLGPVSVEMCIDEPSKAVLWERFEVTQGSPSPVPVRWVLSLTKIERDPGFSPDEFKIPPNVPTLEQAFEASSALYRLWQLEHLPLNDCSGSSPSAGCVNPFALHDGN